MRISRRLQFLVLALVLLSLVTMVTAQTTGTATASVTISPVALLTVSVGTAPTFVVGEPDDAGALPLITPAGTPTYLQYTVVSAGVDKRITASCDEPMLAGLKLDVWAAVPTGTGDLGIPAPGGLTVSPGYLADAAFNLITNIASCATGSGATQGPAVYYTLSIDAATLSNMVVTGATTFTITYSLIGP
jgi:hypothetical protein